jgi:hypothetical protein
MVVHTAESMRAEAFHMELLFFFFEIFLLDVFFFAIAQKYFNESKNKQLSSGCLTFVCC